MENEPCEELGVDDSDVSCFVPPCNNLHGPSTSNSNAKSIIPGPAGTLQAALMHRDRNNSLSTQEFVSHVFHEGNEFDPVFSSNPWLCAIQFVAEKASPMMPGDMMPYMDASGTTYSWPMLSSLKKHLEQCRMPQVVAVIKSCRPNGLGDMLVTLKDPTASVDASIHRKVLMEFGHDISVGSVLVLQKVPIFCPFRSTCYLSITLSNISKIFPKDCGLPYHP